MSAWRLSRRPLSDLPLVTREGVGEAWEWFEGRQIDWGRHLVLPPPIQDKALTKESG